MGTGNLKYGAAPKRSKGTGPEKYGRGPLEVPKAEPASFSRPAENQLLDPEGAVEGPKRHRIQGKRASNLEWMVYQALRRLKWTDDDIEFQVGVLGGRLPGGAVLDFVVWTYAGPVIIEPDGDHWHAALQQQQQDADRVSMVQQVWDRPFFYHRLRQAQMQSQAQVDREVEKMVGRG